MSQSNSQRETPESRPPDAGNWYTLRDLPLRKKFRVISIILIIGFLALGGAYFNVNEENAAAIQQTTWISEFGQDVSDINVQFLRLRALEKDFMLFRQESLLEEHINTLKSTDQLIRALTDKSPTEEIKNLLVNMVDYLELYRDSFNQMAISMQTAGLNDTNGLKGQLNKSASNINELVQEAGETVLQNSLLKMRQLERQYMEEPATAYKTALTEEHAVFLAILSNIELDEDIRLFIRGDLDVYINSLFTYGEKLQVLNRERATFSGIALEFTPLFSELRSAEKVLLNLTRENTRSSQVRSLIFFVAVIALIAVCVNITFLTITRSINTSLQQAVQLSAAIASGKLDNTVEIASRDETGTLLRGLQDMQAKLSKQQCSLESQIEQTRLKAEEASTMAQEQARMASEQTLIATENGRIRQALDDVSSPVLMLDENLLINYVNKACQHMFRAGENDIRKTLPAFRADRLIGKTVEYLYPDGNRAGIALRNLAATKTTSLQLGSRCYLITASPVIDPAGNRIGTVAEWQDRTSEVAVEQEVQSIVQAAMQGDLARRINLQNKTGFLCDLSSGVNQLMEVAESIITETVETMSQLASGNLEHAMEGDYQGIFARLKSDVNSTVAKLTDVVRNIQQSATGLETVASQISESNDEVAMRTEQQAASLEETAAAIEQMTATIRQTASNTEEASNLAGKASEQAEAGGAVVAQAVGAMADISNSSKQIASIISVIDEISFQTNLLALNAAVEAARAGDQGRGFAVVADEVRKLAAHSANAAKEIKELIAHSNRQVERGSSLVNKSGEALHSIVTSIKRVSTIITEISSASQEQAEGIEQVNISITNMDEGTQQNAAMVETVTGSINIMTDEVQGLNEMIRFFALEKRPQKSYLRQAAS